MRKNKIKRLAALVLSIICVCSASVSYAKDGYDNCSATVIGDTSSPMYVGISVASINFDTNSNGSLHCDGYTSVWKDYNAGIVAELQQYDGGWNTIKTWSDYAADFASVDNNWFVVGGYSYRLKTTHYAYDSNWNQVYSVVKYSKTIIK